MKILVTGANGYIGTGVINNLVRENFKIIATDFSCDRIKESVKKVECNLFAVDNPFDFFDNPDILLHLAWRNGFVHDSDTHMQDLPQHYKFLKKMIESGIKKVVVLGTMHEVGYWEGAIDENTPCKPMSLYGISKNALREATEILCKKNSVPLQWVRGFYIVGNTEKGASIFSKIILSAHQLNKEFPFTTGKNKYDFVDYDVFCMQIAEICANFTEFGIINACSGKPVSLADRVEEFIRKNSLDIKLKYGAFPDRPYDSPAVWGDDSKIKKIILNK